MSAHGPVRRVWDAMRAQRRELALAAFVGFLASASAVALLGFSVWLVATASTQPPVLSLSVAAASVRAFALGRAVFRYAERLVGHDAAFRGLTGLRVAVYERLERLAPVGLARFTRGDLLARLVADVDTALDLPLRVVLPWAQAVLVSAITVAFVAWVLPTAGLILGVALVLGLAAVPWLAARTGARAEARLAPARGELSAAVVSTLRGTPDLLAYGATGQALRRTGGLDDELTGLARREAAALGSAAGIGTLVQGLAVVLTLLAAVPAVGDGRLEPVWLAVVALLPLAAYDVLATLPSSALALQRVRGSGERIAEVVDAPVPVHEPDRPAAVPTGPYAVATTGLVARWRDDGAPALRGVDLALAPGERVAVVGPSGAGKSTLAAVLLRFLDYQGSARLAGTELSELEGDDVRAVVGLLGQDAHVFDTTVAGNLRLAAPQADDEVLTAALDRVGLGPWLRALPGGLEGEVGEFGHRMSGGERQRLALARLLLADRAVLVLDEPTEHLDPQTADALGDVLLDVTEGRTTLLVTHRLRGLERVDRVVVLVDGRVAEAGPHEALVAGDGWYARRWEAEREQLDLAALTAAVPPGTAVPGPAAGGAG
ncbi:MAG: thiol reductant ABC exporter subunit CydC [Candidatus Nanopelagicales bacterium]